ncbi:MAG TPA: hypothetical protein GXX57_00625 [Firmicutes bacterium]|nr:hypothetical protein [Bacillota bacterium]
MVYLKSMVTNLAVLVLLLVGLEWLLPAGDVRRIVKAVMGLVVLATLLNPLLTLLTGGWSAQWGGVWGTLPTAAYEDRGEQVIQAGQRVLFQHWQREMEKQASSLILGLGDVLACQVTFTIEPELSCVVRVTTVKDGAVAKNSIAPVEIRVGERPPARGGLQEQIYQVLHNAYGLLPEQIEIIYEGV